MIAPMLATLALSTLSAGAWRVAIPIRASVKGEAYVRVRLPSQIDAGAYGRYADLRVIDDRNEEVAYALDPDDPAPSFARGLVPYDGSLWIDAIEGGRCHWTIGFGGARVGLTQLEFGAPGGTFSRDVLIEASDDGATWNALVNGTVWRYDNGEARLDIPFPETYARRFRVTVYNNDDEPIVGLRPRFYGRAREIVFRTKPHHNYRLLSGNPDANAPVYDLPVILQHEKWTATRVESAATTGESARDEERSWFARSTWTITAAFAASVTVLAALVYRALRSEQSG